MAASPVDHSVSFVLWESLSEHGSATFRLLFCGLILKTSQCSAIIPSSMRKMSAAIQFTGAPRTRCSKLVDSGVVIGKIVRYPVAIFVGLKISCLLFRVRFEFGCEIRPLDPKVPLEQSHYGGSRGTNCSRGLQGFLIGCSSWNATLDQSYSLRLSTIDYFIGHC